jgi:pullulanase/glycogen debranching enzyme
VPFIHAGDEMLRSKSMDRNSYNSGDWFNRLDFTYQSNNFGVGLPPAGDNQDNWPTIKPLLANPDLKPTGDDIQNSVARVEEFLRIRKSSPLFHLQTADDIMARVSFPDSRPDQTLGLIVMVLADDGDLADLDPNAQKIVVIFNANRDAQTFADDSLVGQDFQLHPVLTDSTDAVVRGSSFDADTGTFTVPGLTTAVFVLGE